jgi:hypothetical protein
MNLTAQFMKQAFEMKEVAKELEIPPDWLNPYYVTFTHVLPADYGSRLITALSFPNLEVQSLSKDDLLIMKCFAALGQSISKRQAERDLVNHPRLEAAGQTRGRYYRKRRKKLVL